MQPAAQPGDISRSPRSTMHNGVRSQPGSLLPHPWLQPLGTARRGLNRPPFVRASRLSCALRPVYLGTRWTALHPILRRASVDYDRAWPAPSGRGWVNPAASSRRYTRITRAMHTAHAARIMHFYMYRTRWAASSVARTPARVARANVSSTAVCRLFPCRSLARATGQSTVDF